MTSLKKINVKKQGPICTVELDGMLQTFLSPEECKKELAQLGYQPDFTEEPTKSNATVVPPVDPKEIEKRLSEGRGEKHRAASPATSNGTGNVPVSSGRSIEDFRQVLLFAMQHANQKNRRILTYKLEAIDELLRFLEDKSNA